MSNVRVGDNGQPFEIRYRRVGDAPDTFRVLGYASNIRGAREMRDTWRKAPGVETVWFIDRRRVKE